MGVRLNDIPCSDRPRERLAALGVEALSEQELLALVLRHGRQGESALDLAASLLAEHGSLRSLAWARPEELASRPGIGAAKAAAIVAAFRLGRLADSTPEVAITLISAADVAKAAKTSFLSTRREKVIVLICNSMNQLRQVETISEGSIDRAIVPVREILNAVLRHDGRAFAIAHNHPSGDPAPSQADYEATKAISRGAATVGLRFLDHVVLAGDAWRSATARR